MSAAAAIEPAEPAPPRGGAATPHPALRLVPLLFLVPVGAALAASLVRLLATGHPVYGWSMSINADAEAMYLGIWPFQDPADGFTGDAYTPLFPATVSLLNHLRFWTGWSVLVIGLSVVCMAVLLAWLAYRPAGRSGRGGRALAMLEAAGIGALGVSFVFGLLRPAVYEARPDHFAWLLGLAGIVAAGRGARGSWRAKALAVLLLSAAFWAKQTAIIASLAALFLVALHVAAGRLAPRAAAAWMGAHAAVNGLILLGLSVLTGGWQYRFNFGITLPVTRTVGEVTPDLAERAAPAIAFAGIALAAAWLTRRRAGPGAGMRVALARAPDRALLGAAFALLALLGAAAGVYLRRYAGGDDNNLIPCIWALAALGALAYGAAGRSRDGATLAALGCVLLFATGFAPGDGKWRLRGGDAFPDRHWADLPSEVESIAKRTLVWHPILSDLNVPYQGVIFPNVLHIQEALLRDRRPRALERALLERRFGVIWGLVAEQGDLARYRDLVWEDNYYWKLNRVVDLKYRPAPRLPSLPGGEAYASLEPVAAHVPRAGADPAPWIDDCFGPFTLAGLEMRIRRGGGLWCVPSPGTLLLRETPARETEVVSAERVSAVGGRIEARLAPVRGRWRMTLDGGWSLAASVTDAERGLHVSVRSSSGRLITEEVVERGALHRTDGRISVRIERGRRPALRRTGEASLVATLPSPREPGLLHIWATRDSGAEFNLQELRAE